MGAALADSDAEVTEILPGLCHVHLPNGLPLIRVAYQDGWTCLSAVVNHAQEPWTLIDTQSRYANLKYALVAEDGARRRVCQLRAEIPVDLGPEGSVGKEWFAAVLTQMRQLLSGSDEPEAKRQTSAPTDSLVELLADLGHAVEPTADGELRVDLASSGLPRRVRLLREGAWWRVVLALGAGDVRVPAEPMRQAVGLFLVRVAADVRFARPFCGYTSQVLGFDAHLPLQPSVEQLDHALAALVTAARHYETEIETLAGEAILSHAFLAIAGGSNRTASPPTYEL